VAPATANLIAKMATGLADDLASTALLVTDQPILVAPAMNFRMWDHPATKTNVATLKERGVRTVGPNSGMLAEGESGMGRMAEPAEILAAIEGILAAGPLRGIKALVTSGPTFEPIDPVRFIGNRSSGKQGHAIATALARLGADVTLVTGPVRLPDPAGVTTVHVETAREMLGACLARLPVDVAVCAAAVADWTVSNASREKRKKEPGAPPPAIPAPGPTPDPMPGPAPGCAPDPMPCPMPDTAQPSAPATGGPAGRPAVPGAAPAGSVLRAAPAGSGPGPAAPPVLIRAIASSLRLCRRPRSLTPATRTGPAANAISTWSRPVGCRTPHRPQYPSASTAPAPHTAHRVAPNGCPHSSQNLSPGSPGSRHTGQIADITPTSSAAPRSPCPRAPAAPPGRATPAPWSGRPAPAPAARRAR